MKKNSAQVFAAFLALFVAGFLFQMPVYAAKIVSGGTTRYYIQVQAERGDSPYSIARMFVDSDAAGKRNPTEVAADFLALNGIRAYNKKGNPLIYPGEIYLVPTQKFNDAMNKFVASLHFIAVVAPAAIPETEKNVPEASDSFSNFFSKLPASVAFLLGILFFVFLAAVIAILHRGMLKKNGKRDEEKASPEYPVEGLTLRDRIVNMLRPYTMEEVAQALEGPVIPVPGNGRSIKICNLPESFRRHKEEWRGEPLHNIITRAEGEARDKKWESPDPDSVRGAGRFPPFGE